MDPYGKGEIAERKVFEVLEDLKEEGKIKNFGQTGQFSNDDWYGIDFLIWPKKGREIRLQVKSSYHEISKKKYLKRGIDYIAVPPKEGKPEVKEKILKILEDAMKQRSQKRKLTTH